MKIYCAGKFARREELRAQAHKLWSLGFDIVSSWLNESTRPEWMTHEEFFTKLGRKDLEEISAADILILEAVQPSETGGKECEWGFALGQNHRKLCWLVGTPKNPFHYLADKVFSDWDSCIAFLAENYQQGKGEPQKGI
jgi:hypothetical protein